MDQPSGVLERFLRYVGYDTRSDEGSETYPSTVKQLALLHTLAEELRAIKLTDVMLDEHGYVFATVPATTQKPNVPVIGFIAHVDTSPEADGANVMPVIHEQWDGGDIAFAYDPALMLRSADYPALLRQIGNDLITASGTTLLGADNKAGVAEIMAAAEYLMQHPEILHGAIRIAFTPDEEIGAGTKFFDVAKFDASCAYTVDGEERGEVEDETFSADSMTVTFEGFNCHPGYGKGKLINSIKAAASFIARLPKDKLSPETTEGREGFVHPYVLDASVEKTSVKFLIRDFDADGLKHKEQLLETLAQQAVADWPGAKVTCQVTEQYRNMKEVLDRFPDVAENAREAMRRSGVEPTGKAIRGGTDGSRLSLMGLPTPNIFAGEHNFHSRLEWISVQDMEKAVEVLVNLAQVWEEKAATVEAIGVQEG